MKTNLALVFVFLLSLISVNAQEESTIGSATQEESQFFKNHLTFFDQFQSFFRLQSTFSFENTNGINF